MGSSSKRSRATYVQRNSEKIARAEARVNQWIGVLDELLDGYEKDHPHWRGLALLWLIEGALLSLRQYLEEKGRSERWRHPFLEVHYDVDWNWKPQSEDDPVIRYGTISSEASDTAMKRQVAKIAVETVVQAALQFFTNNVALEQKGKQYLPLLPLEVVDVLRKIRGRRQRQMVVDELYRPFSMGAAEVEFDESAMSDDGELSAQAKREIGSALTQIDLQPITLTITKDKRTLRLNPVFLIYPLVVDVRKKRAYYPISVGLMLVPEALAGEDALTLFDEPWVRPETWSLKDRRHVWKEMIAAFRQVAESLEAPKETPASEAVLTVNAKLRVPIDPKNLEQANHALEEMIKSFHQAGTIVEMNHAWTSPLHLNPPAVADLLKCVDDSAVHEKGPALEKLVAALFASVPGFVVKANAHTETEEIDLVVINGHDDPRWKTGSPLILVECKNRADACDKNDIVQFRAKLENRRGQCRLGFMVSMNGFARTVRDELLRNSRENLVIVLIDGESVRKAVSDNAFVPVLQSAWDQAVIS